MHEHSDQNQGPVANGSGEYPLKPRPEDAVPPSPSLRWCPYVGNWCEGRNCYCELTLFA